MSQSTPYYAISSMQSLPTTSYHAPQPIAHSLTQRERNHLLKTTPKLTSVLKSTPHIASAPAAPAPLSIPPYKRTREPPTPRTKKSRRTGRVFTPTSIPSNFAAYNSSNTSLSSSDSGGEDGEAEKDGYVVVKTGGGTGYHYHNLNVCLPVNHRGEAIKVSLVPSSEKAKGKKGGKALPPPLLLRFRAVPVDNRRDGFLSTTSSIPAVALSHLSPAFPVPASQTRSQTQNITKLNKLSRTFGEPVPPELILPTQSRTPSLKLLKKVEEKIQEPRLSAGECKARREGREGAIDIDSPHLPLPLVGLAMVMPTPTFSTQNPSSTSSLGVRVTQHSTRSGSLAQTPRRAPRPRSLTLLSPLPALPPSLPLPHPPVDDSSDSDECDTPPTSTDDLPELLKEYLDLPSNAAVNKAPLPPHEALLSPRYAYSQSTPNLRSRTTSSGVYRSLASKAHHRIPSPTHGRSRILDNRSSRTFYDVSSTEELGMNVLEEDGYGHRRERGWSGEWNVNVGEVRRLLRELKAR